MDLTVSPDLDAWICYGVVLLFGGFTAFRQVNLRLGNIGGIWIVPRTWLLCLLYLAVPILLFWFLDRSGAINDTSLFAAILIAVGYEGIITGANSTVKVSGEVSKFWTPFLAYADSVSKRVIEQRDRQQKRLDERIIASIAADPKRYAALEALAKRYASDVAALEKQLIGIEAESPTRGTADILERKTRALYAVMLSVPDGYYTMKDKGVVDRTLYWWHYKRIGTLFQVLLVGLIVIGLIAVVLIYAAPDYRQKVADYYIWRIAKTNSTTLDQLRSRRQLVDSIGVARVKDETTRRLAGVLRRPSLPMDRADLVLQTLLESRAANGGNPGLPRAILQSLRASSVDARSRVNDVLAFLAKGETCPNRTLGDGLRNWKPSNGDSTSLLEERIKDWTDYWEKACLAPT